MVGKPIAHSHLVAGFEFIETIEGGKSDLQSQFASLADSVYFFDDIVHDYSTEDFDDKQAILEYFCVQLGL